MERLYQSIESRKQKSSIVQQTNITLTRKTNLGLKGDC